jgi:hypothetical protein
MRRPKLRGRKARVGWATLATSLLVASAVMVAGASSNTSSPPTTIGAAPVSPGGPPPTWPSAPNSPAPTAVPTHEGAPVVSPASSACSPEQVTAKFGGSGPYGAFNGDRDVWQVIIDITSTSPCFVSGYPSIAFATSAGAITQSATVSGGYFGPDQPVSLVTLGPGIPASFLIEGSQILADNGSCPNDSSINFTLPNLTTPIQVDMGGTGLLACGSVNVTPFIQGNSADRYL